MGSYYLPEMFHCAKQVFTRQKSVSKQQLSCRAKGSFDVPRGHFAIYVGQNEVNRKRFVVPISYLKHPLFQDLLHRAAEEFDFHHGMDNLVIPCAVQDFVTIASNFNI